MRPLIIAHRGASHLAPENTLTSFRLAKTLGADGFGLSDTRDAARRHFGVDAESIVVAALAQLARRGEVKATAVKEARERYGL